MMQENTGLIVRATIDQIEAKRARALNLYGAAHDALCAANEAAGDATQRGIGYLSDAARMALTGQRERGKAAIEKARADFVEECRRDLDRGIWKFLMDAMGIERLMDATARESWEQSLRDNPPEATADNCFATMEQLRNDSGLIFKRGIATVFAKLDRRFRSHDGFKIGARVVLSYFLDQFNSVNDRQRNTLRDIERTFLVLDGKEQVDWAGGIGGVLSGATSGLERRAFEVENDYFRVKAFKNGNAHVWFKRDDLLLRVNLLLADYYGAALGVDADAADVKHEPTRAVAKNFALFETPARVVSELLGEAGIPMPDERGGHFARHIEPLTVLEPSAGRGRIAFALDGAGHKVTCVEIQPDLARGLSTYPLRTINADFLDVTPAGLGLFDRVAMNPPFDRQRDIDHVMHAFQFLKPGGVLASVMSSSVEFREDRKATDFRAFVERMGGHFRDLPPASFAESGTNVNTVICVIRAPRGV